MDTSVCRIEPPLVRSEIGFYDRAQLEMLVRVLGQALEAVVFLSDGIEKNTATARDIIAVRLAVGRVVGATMNLQPRKAR
jgi:hypothetical protein